MFKPYFFILLLSHIVGDFYFQTEKMAKKKDTNVKWLVMHGIVYWISFFAISIPTFSMELCRVGILIAFLHMLVDMTKYLMIQKIKKNRELLIVEKRNFYILDQIIHLSILIIGAYYLAENTYELVTFEIFKNFFRVIGISQSQVLVWATVLLIIHKPANITLSYLIATYRPNPKENQIQRKKDFKAGKFIGTVERIIIVILIHMGQYSAIGLVLTAKSIARYDEIVKHKISAEYYLLGTLISTLLAILASFFL